MGKVEITTYIDRLIQAQNGNNLERRNAIWELLENYRILELNIFGTSKLLESKSIGKIEIKLNEGLKISHNDIARIALEIESIFTTIESGH